MIERSKLIIKTVDSWGEAVRVSKILEKDGKTAMIHSTNEGIVVHQITDEQILYYNELLEGKISVSEFYEKTGFK